MEWLLVSVTALCAGSFIGVVADRLPAGEPLVFDRSACPHCRHTLAARDLVPLASWIAARGRCRYCSASLGLAYPAFELAALAAALWSFATLPGWLAWAGCLLGWTLIALSVIDWRHYWLPDALTLPLVPIGLLVAWGATGTAWDQAIGAAAGFIVLAAVRAIYGLLRRREGLGLGDAKLLAAAGAWVGWAGLPSVVLIAAATALIVHLTVKLARPGQDDSAVPIAFGPYLAAGFWLVWLYGPLQLG